MISPCWFFSDWELHRKLLFRFRFPWIVYDSGIETFDRETEIEIIIRIPLAERLPDKPIGKQIIISDVSYILIFL